MLKALASKSANRKTQHWLIGAGVGLLLVAVLSAFKLSFDQALGAPVPFLLYFGAVLVASWLSGTLAGLLTTLVATLAAFTFFIYPQQPEIGAATWQLLGFVLENIAITWITSRLQKERARAVSLLEDLETSASRLNLVVRGMSDGIAVQARNGEIVYANEPAATIAGFASPEDMQAASAAEVVARFKMVDAAGQPLSPRDLPSREAAETGQPQHAVVGFTTAETPEQRWSSITSNPLLDANGQVEYVVNVFRDITASRFHEEAVRVSREWFSTALRSIGDGIIATDEHNRITFMNPAAEALTGWKLESAREQALSTVFVVLDETTQQPIESPVQRALRGGPVVNEAKHTLLRRKDGFQVTIEESAAPIHNSAGALVGAVVVVRDVSEKRRAELARAFLAQAAAELEGSLDYQTTLANVARFMVPTMADWCAIDMLETGDTLRRLAVAHVDPAKLHLIEEIERRYPPDPKERRGALRILGSGQVEFIPHISDEMLTHAARDAGHLSLLAKLGLRSYVGVPLKRSGKTIGVITLATAESARRYTEADVEFAVALAERAAMAVDRSLIFRELRNANRAKDEFLAILGHELRNPLAPIYSALELMNQRAGDTLVHERLVIERQLKHVMRLVDDLLDVSRISGGKVDLQSSPQPLAEVVTAAVEVARPLLDERRILLEIEVPEQLVANGDRTRLIQILGNLLHNAAKYGRDGGKIWVTGERRDDVLVLAVKDDGIGITEDMLPKVFDLFSQESQALDRAQGGLGLGLAIVKSLVQLHSGTVTAQSGGAGQGATFTLTLPAHDGAAQVAPITGPLHPSGRTLRILIVDDNQDALELLSMGIELLGNEVFSAPNATQALVAAETHRPDIAFMDVGLPDMDGYELARRIRQLDHLRGMKLVAVTGYGRAVDRQRALEAGFDVHLVKPVSLQQIQQVLER